MSSSPESSLVLQPTFDSMHALSGFVDAFAAQHALHQKDTYALQVACEELFTNTLRHGDPPANEVEVRMEWNAAYVAVTYIDDGGAYDTASTATPDTTLPAHERAIGGLGAHLIRTMMRNFEYERRGNRNHTVFHRLLTRG